jgi:hypothetical protein
MRFVAFEEYSMGAQLVTRATEIEIVSRSMARPISKTTTFILSLPPTLPAKDVLVKAKSRGISTSENNVHRVRRLHRRLKAAIARTPANGGPERAVKVLPTLKGLSPALSVEALLRAVAAEIGLGRAVEILQSERASVRAVFGR